MDKLESQKGGMKTYITAGGNGERRKRTNNVTKPTFLDVTEGPQFSDIPTLSVTQL